jgi:8-oxo-dGTP pyrophosphatase MutT (NUDIX family)
MCAIRRLYDRAICYEKRTAMHGVTPEDAATVILVREGRGGLEAYMTQRQERLKFMGGYYVFPGGKVDAADLSDAAAERCRWGGRDARARLAGVDDARRALGFWVAAVRELFEETGVLIAEDEAGRPLDGLDAAGSARLAQRRQELHARRRTFPELLRDEGLYLALDSLLWCAHWITPSTSPRRFSTFFFMARQPAGQEPRPFAPEIAHAAWASPEAALDHWREGRWPLIPPTIASLDTLARYPSWSALHADFSRPPSEHPRTVWTGF